MWERSADEIQTELSPREELLWSGQPPQGLKLRASDAFLIPFSLLWGGFAIAWEAGVILLGAPWIMALFGVPFVLIGLYMIVGRFFVDARMRGHTFYGVTSERIIIVSGIWRRTVKSLDLDSLSDISLTQRGPSAGLITFGPLAAMIGWHRNTFPGAHAMSVPCFDLAEEAREVYQIIREAQREARQRADAE